MSYKYAQGVLWSLCLDGLVIVATFIPHFLSRANVVNWCILIKTTTYVTLVCNPSKNIFSSLLSLCFPAQETIDNNCNNIHNLVNSFASL